MYGAPLRRNWPRCASSEKRNASLTFCTSADGRYFLTRSVSVATVATPLCGSGAASERQTAFFSASAARRAKPGCGCGGSAGFEEGGGSADRMWVPRR